jgi:hypothetical protein
LTLSLLVTALLVALGAPADGGESLADPVSLETHFQVDGDPNFGDPRALLRRFLLDSHVAGAKPQHFCVLGRESVRKGVRDRTALIFWREGNKLILWEGQQPPWALVDSRRLWDLARDVVDTLEQVRGSTYLLTKAWVEEKRHDCAVDGESLIVAAAERSNRPIPLPVSAH